MTTVETQHQNPVLSSVYDKDAYSSSDFESELASVEQATAVEREWIAAKDMRPYVSDKQILNEAASGHLVRVASGIGYIARQYLRDWAPERADPSHEFHYSPPFVRPEVKDYIDEIGKEWQLEMGACRSLSITSLVRSIPYQRNLALQDRKLTIVSEDKLSSHQVGLAFDVDGCGIVEEDESGNLRAINPRTPSYDHSLVSESRLVLKSILSNGMFTGRINFVEELPGTQQHCFHVALNPLKF